jgi:urea transport system ATP-binding protein
LSSEDGDRVEEILDMIGLAEKPYQIAGSLSHGEKQWLEIGMVMAQEAQLLLIDEPVAGMTEDETEKTGRLLQAIAKERSVLVIEHDMQFVRQIANKVSVLHEGRLLCEGPVDEVQNNEQVMEIYLGRG